MMGNTKHSTLCGGDHAVSDCSVLPAHVVHSTLQHPPSLPLHSSSPSKSPLMMEHIQSMMSSLGRTELSTSCVLKTIAREITSQVDAEKVFVYLVDQCPSGGMEITLEATCDTQDNGLSPSKRLSVTHQLVNKQDLSNHIDKGRTSRATSTASAISTHQSTIRCDSLIPVSTRILPGTKEFNVLEHVAITAASLNVSGEEFKGDSSQVPFANVCKNFLVSPVVMDRGNYQHDVVAIIQVCDKRGGTQFDESDVNLLFCLGTAVAQSIEKALVYEDSCAMRKQQEKLLEVIELCAAENDFDGVCVRVAAAAEQLLCGSVHLYRYHTKTHKLVCKVCPDHKPACVGEIVKIDSELGKKLCSIVDNAEKVNHVIGNNGQFHTLHFPIVHCKKVLCVVVVERPVTEEAFGSKEERIVQAFVRVTASVIHKAYVADALNLAQKRSICLIKVLKTSADSNASIGDLINKVIEVAYEILDASKITLFFPDHLRSDLYCVVDPDGNVGSLDMSSSVAGYVARSGKGVNITNRDERPVGLPEGAENNYTSMLCCPVRDEAQTHTIAVLQATDKKLADGTIGTFHTSDYEMMDAFCVGVGGTLRRHLTELKLKRGDFDETVQSLLDIYGYNREEITKKKKNKDKTTLGTSPPYSPRRHTQQQEKMKFKTTIQSTNGPCIKLSYNRGLQKRCEVEPDLVNDPDPLPLTVREGIELLDGLDVTYQDKVTAKNANLAITLLEANEVFNRLHLIGGVIVPSLFYGPIVNLDDIRSLAFNVFDYTPEELMAACILMLVDVGCVANNGVHPETLSRFVQAVRSNYHDHAYHNWYHGVAVMHFSYLTIITTKAGQFLDDLDMLSLLVAGLCHDLDHPGQGNAFQINARTDLALTHNDISVLENHHAVTTFQLLRKPAWNIFESLPHTDVTYVRKVIIQAILATDMAHHYEICKKLDSQKNGVDSLDKNKTEDRIFLVNLIVHASDLAGQVVPLKIAQIWQVLVASEFIKEEELSIEMGLPVAPFMQRLADRETAYQNHLNFIDLVMTPLWRGVVNIFPELDACEDYLRSNRNFFHIRKEEEKASKRRRPSQFDIRESLEDFQSSTVSTAAGSPDEAIMTISKKGGRFDIKIETTHEVEEDGAGSSEEKDSNREDPKNERVVDMEKGAEKIWQAGQNAAGIKRELREPGVQGFHSVLNASVHGKLQKE